MVIEEFLAQNYPGLLSGGLTQDEVSTRFAAALQAPGYVIPCLHDSTKLQVGADGTEALEKIASSSPISNETLEALRTFLVSTVMPLPKVKEFVLSKVPELDPLFEIWDASMMKSMTLTSVGIAIAAANARRRIGHQADLSIWI